MRIISMSMTARQFTAGTKTVTRRVGWKYAEKGTRLRVVKKALGLKRGEFMQTLGYIELVSIRSESLMRLINEPDYGKREVALEGFPTWTPRQFVDFFCEGHCVLPSAMVRRLEFIKIDVDDGRVRVDEAAE
jgi:hypothetical protein